MGISMWFRGHQLNSHAILFLLCLQAQRGPVSETSSQLLGQIISLYKWLQWDRDEGVSSDAWTLWGPPPFSPCKCIMLRSDGGSDLSDTTSTETAGLVMEEWCWGFLGLICTRANKQRRKHCWQWIRFWYSILSAQPLNHVLHLKIHNQIFRSAGGVCFGDAWKICVYSSHQNRFNTSRHF